MRHHRADPSRRSFLERLGMAWWMMGLPTQAWASVV